MIEADRLKLAAEKLRVYDVEQGAWEHEQGGFAANATHVLYHVVKDFPGKNLSEDRVVETEVAPDCVQYALRLMRWTGQEASAVLPTDDQGNTTRVLASEKRFASVPLHQLAFMEAGATIARQLHNYDHERTKALATTNEIHAARRAGRLLMYAADLQAEGFDFDLFEAFDTRLANLRQRFGIAEPSTPNSN
jgi:hypothetical protein